MWMNTQIVRNRVAGGLWEALGNSYPDYVQVLRVSVGRYLNIHHPDVEISHVFKTRVEYLHPATGARLRLDHEAEAIPTPRGWQGAVLSGWRPNQEAPAVQAQLLLNWVSRGTPGWVEARRPLPLLRQRPLDDAMLTRLTKQVLQ